MFSNNFTLHALPSLALQFSFSSAVLLGAYWSRRGLQDPNPPRHTDGEKATSKDFLFQAGLWLAPAPYKNVFALIGICHAVFALLPDPQRAAVCPNYNGGVDMELFRWTGYTIPVIAVLCVAGYIRLQAFSNLGSSFTFHLTKPQRLVNTGLHRYVRHPSYTALISQLIAAVLLLCRSQGLLGCWIPVGAVSRVVEAGLLLWAGVVIPLWFRIRVNEEERMLKETFGEEWDEYCTYTQRFIPGIF